MNQRLKPLKKISEKLNLNFFFSLLNQQVEELTNDQQFKLEQMEKEEKGIDQFLIILKRG